MVVLRAVRRGGINLVMIPATLAVNVRTDGRAGHSETNLFRELQQFVLVLHRVVLPAKIDATFKFAQDLIYQSSGKFFVAANERFVKDYFQLFSCSPFVRCLEDL